MKFIDTEHECLGDSHPARKPDSSTFQDINMYREIIKKTQDKCDIIIQGSTGGQGCMEDKERIDVFDAGSEMAWPYTVVLQIF